LITRITFGDEYRWLSSSLCSLLHSPVASSPLGPNILLSALFSNTQNNMTNYTPTVSFEFTVGSTDTPSCKTEKTSLKPKYQ
jgi:hypothetical protein